MTRFIEQKFCSLFQMNPYKTFKFNDWFMKIDPPIWIAANFENRNPQVQDPDWKKIVYRPISSSLV